jgi:predicted RNase H-like HicB family nuclease
MTPTVVAGGISDSDNMEVVTVRQQVLSLRYAPAELPASTSYRVALSPRLRIGLRQSEQGWIASAPELNALGDGDTAEAAMESLGDSIEQYLEYVRDDKPQLAPAIAHHAAFVALLHVPRALWFASVSFDAAALG